MCLAEASLKTLHKIVFKGYKVYRKDVERSRDRGILTVVRNCINIEIIDINNLCGSFSPNIGILTLKLQLIKKNIVISTVYNI